MSLGYIKKISLTLVDVASGFRYDVPEQSVRWYLNDTISTLGKLLYREKEKIDAIKATYDILKPCTCAAMRAKGDYRACPTCAANYQPSCLCNGVGCVSCCGPS